MATNGLIRVGLVGYGMASKVFHAPVVSAVEGLSLAAVVERNSRNAEADYPNIATYPSLEAMLSDASLDLIVVATPNATHAALAQQALAAGRHVVVDKPVAPTSAEIDSLIELSKIQGKLLVPFHNRRWDSDFQTLHQLIREQSVGRVVYLESTFDRWRPHPRLAMWKEDGTPGGGNMLDLGTHLVDQAIVLFGLPEAVSADVRNERDNAVTDDSFSIRLRYSGLIVHLSGNCLAAIPRPRYSLRGNHGSFVKWGLDPQEARLKEAGRLIPSGWGEEPASAWGTLTVDVDGCTVTRPVQPIPGDYRLFYQGVRDAILGKSAPPVEAAARQVARILELARQSSQDRREIPLDWPQP